MITLKECQTLGDHMLFGDIVDKHHSYVKHVRTPTRRIHWLVENDGETIGAIGINSCTMNLAPRDNLLGVKTNAGRLRRLKNLANNYRFCLIKDKCPPNAASQALRLMREAAPEVWKRKYGNKLFGIETFVGNGLPGSCYKADNWQYLGETKGWSMKRLPKKLMDPEQYARWRKKWKRNVVAERTDPKKIFFTGVDRYRKAFAAKAAQIAQKKIENLVDNRLQSA